MTESPYRSFELCSLCSNGAGLIDRLIVSALHNGVVVVDSDTENLGEITLDQELYQITLMKSDLLAVQRRGGKSHRRALSSGEIVAVRPGEIDSVIVDDKNPLQRAAMSSVLFRQDVAKRLMGDFDFGEGISQEDPLMAALIDAAAKMAPNSDPLVVDHVTLAILHRMRGRQPAPDTRSKGRIERAVAYINERYREKITLHEIAGAAAMSTFHFARTFRKTVGVTPLAYVMGRRVECAKDEIAKDSHPLGLIAFICGFSSQSHFSTTFKEFTGVTPLAYRKQVLGR